MNLQQILNAKGCNVHTVPPTVSLTDAVALLVQNNCGSLVVYNSDEMVGIISERDILRACDSDNCSLGELLVEQFMTRDVYTGKPTDSIENTMGLMTEKRIRHLPIMNNGSLSGIISIGDIVKAQYDQLSLENHYLKSYIQS